jgi:hypothetical protein
VATSVPLDSIGQSTDHWVHNRSYKQHTHARRGSSGEARTLAVWIRSCHDGSWVQQKRAVAANRLAPAWWPERNWRVRETNESLRDRRLLLRFVFGPRFCVMVTCYRLDYCTTVARVKWSRRGEGGAHDAMRCDEMRGHEAGLEAGPLFGQRICSSSDSAVLHV